MWTSFFFVQLIASFVGSAAFAVIFKTRPKHIPWAALGGTITYFIYYIIEFSFSSLFAAAFFASVVSALYSEFCARIFRAPTTIFLIPCAIPIVPGGSLYYTMFNLISKDVDPALMYFSNTLSVAIGIAGGIAAVTLAFHFFNGAMAHLHAKRQSENDK